MQRERERERERSFARREDEIKLLQYVFGYAEVALSEIAEYASERIDSSFVSVENYVSVENLLQNKQGKTNASSIPENTALIQYKSNDILIGNIRPYLKKIWQADTNGGTNGDVLTVRIKMDSPIAVIPRFLYHILASDEFFNYDNGHSKGAKMPRGDKDAVMRFQLNIPTKDVQERIVSILDRFDILCNDITEGLPAEIEARQKQYEYYRDRLLSFKER